MNDKGYINIQGWMINQLNLNGNELILYAIIFGFSQDGESEYFGSQRYIAEAMKVSLPTANKLINKLLKKELVIKTKESHYKAVKESLTDEKVLKKVKHQRLRKFNKTVKESLTNNNTINKDNNISEQGSQVNLFIEELRFLNETGYTKWYSNKTQRKNVELLMKRFTIKQIRELIRFIKLNDGKQFFPSIVTPTQLVDKLPQVEKFYKSKGYKKEVPQVVM